MINKIHDILFVPADRQAMYPKEYRHANLFKIAVISATAAVVFALIAAATIFSPLTIGVSAAVLVGVASGAFTLSLLASAVAIVAAIGAHQNREVDDREPLRSVVNEQKNTPPKSPVFPKNWRDDKEVYDLLKP
jgi:hypothetical protein